MIDYRDLKIGGQYYFRGAHASPGVVHRATITGEKNESGLFPVEFHSSWNGGKYFERNDYGVDYLPKELELFESAELALASSSN